MGSTSSVNLHGNTIVDSTINMYQNTSESIVPQTSGHSKAKQLPKLCNFPNLPETVDKREGDVGNLRKLMSEHHKVVITGIAGLGKTTLANLCARKWVEDDTYHHAIFVNMETEESASGDYKRLAKMVLNTKDDDYSEDTILEIYQYFSEYHILIIFDNIDENCVFHKYYQKSKELANIDILGTSQLTELRRLFHPYSLQELSEEASVQLILDIFSSAEIEVPATVVPMITDIVVQLWFHPLALQHAAALIIDMFHNDIPEMSLEQSLNKYKQHFETKLNEGFPTDHLSEYRKSVYAAIALNIEKATVGKEHVKSLLHCMTYLDPSWINIKIFYKAFSTDLIQESLRQLKRYSLISVYRDVLISMHRLVPRVCHAMLTADDKITYLNRWLNVFFHYTEVLRELSSLASFSEACSSFTEHFEVNFNIKKKELAAYYKAAFHNNQQIKERLTARLQMINCVISDAEGWSAEQCCVFAGHQIFCEYFTGKPYYKYKYVYETCTTQVGFVQVIRDSSLVILGCTSILNFYENNKEELNKPIFKNLTILSICAAFGIRDHDFNKLIDMGCNVNIKDNNGMTPILWAAKHMSYKKVFTLLHHGATCDVLYKEILTAAAAGDGESVLRLLQTSEVSDATGEYGKMLLWWAAGEGHHDNVRELVQRGTDTSGADTRGNTLLHMVARGGYDGTVSQFIRAAGDVNTANSDRDTALILAARYGHDEIVSELIAAKADINIANSGGNTALMRAIKHRHDEITTQLIQADANVNIANNNGETPLYWAAVHGHREVVTELVNRGAHVDTADRYGTTPLLLTAEHKHREISMNLIEKGASVNTVICNDTPLLYAAKYGDYELALELIRRGARTDIPANDRGETPLLWAQWNGDDKMEHIITSQQRRLN